jgi:hypothetical protein
VHTNGYVGIGTASPSYNLQVQGTIYSSGDITAFSDERYKTDLLKIYDGLDKVSQLTGYTFKVVDDESHRSRTGLLAQDVQKVLKEAVYEDNDGKLSISYGNLSGLIIEAVKELDTKLTKFMGDVNVQNTENNTRIDAIMKHLGLN